MRIPADPQKLARVVELHYEGNPAAVIARTLKLPPRTVSTLISQLSRHPLGAIALHLAERSSRLAWHARVRRSLAELGAPAKKVPRIGRLGRKELLERYYAQLQPVVLTGMMGETGPRCAGGRCRSSKRTSARCR